jgi:hypothetical protein
MWTVLLILLVAWVVLSIVGFVFDGLMWLGIIGIVLFVGTIICGIIRQRARRLKQSSSRITTRAATGRRRGRATRRARH